MSNPQGETRATDDIQKTKTEVIKGAGVGGGTGAVVGALVGSVVPGVGTLVGGAIGGFIGAMVGGGAGVREVKDISADVYDAASKKFKD